MVWNKRARSADGQRRFEVILSLYWLVISYFILCTYCFPFLGHSTRYSPTSIGNPSFSNFALLFKRAYSDTMLPVSSSLTAGVSRCRHRRFDRWFRERLHSLRFLPLSGRPPTTPPTSRSRALVLCRIQPPRPTVRRPFRSLASRSR